MGFVGTVRGILESLSSADAIVWAANRAERAFAIGELSGELGLAFATTLVALLSGIIISWLNDLQTRSEANFLHDLEQLSAEILDGRSTAS